MWFLRVFRHLVENQILNGPYLAQLKDNLPRLAAAQLFDAKLDLLPPPHLLGLLCYRDDAETRNTGFALKPGRPWPHRTSSVLCL